MQLLGKTFVVTGGANGLGAAIVFHIAELGASVAILDIDEENGQIMSNELGPRVKFYFVDVSKEFEVKEVIKSVVEDFGGIHVCIANAGVGDASLTYCEEKGVLDSEVFDKLMRINTYGVINIDKYCAEAIAQQTPDEDGLRGVIINIASVAAEDGQRGMVAYAASKGAVTAITLPMARDLGHLGIRVVCIEPGLIESPITAAASEEIKRELIKSVIAPKRLGKAEEFVKLVMSVVENSYLNGVNIRLDGGIRFPYSC